MNSKKFTEAMSKIDNKYVGEALFYNGTRLAKKSSKATPHKVHKLEIKHD